MGQMECFGPDPSIAIVQVEELVQIPDCSFAAKDEIHYTNTGLKCQLSGVYLYLVSGSREGAKKN